MNLIKKLVENYILNVALSEEHSDKVFASVDELLSEPSTMTDEELDAALKAL